MNVGTVQYQTVQNYSQQSQQAGAAFEARVQAARAQTDEAPKAADRSDEQRRTADDKPRSASRASNSNGRGQLVDIAV